MGMKTAVWSLAVICAAVFLFPRPTAAGFYDVLRASLGNENPFQQFPGAEYTTATQMIVKESDQTYRTMVIQNGGSVTQHFAIQTIPPQSTYSACGIQVYVAGISDPTTLHVVQWDGTGNSGVGGSTIRASSSKLLSPNYIGGGVPSSSTSAFVELSPCFDVSTTSTIELQSSGGYNFGLNYWRESGGGDGWAGILFGSPSDGVGALNAQLEALGATSTSITTACPDFGFFTPLCDFVLWLVVPDPKPFARASQQLQMNLQTRFPLSYVTAFHSAWTTGFTAATATPPVLTMNFQSAYASGTAFGTFLPTSTTLFASSTVSTYVPSPVWNTLKILFATVIYIGTVQMVYFGAVRLFRPKNV